MAVAKLDRDGVAIHYEVHGHGPTILLSHGYSATCRMWDGQIARAVIGGLSLGGYISLRSTRCTPR
jgi:pimeloyl-ACP methyl ester carboxylesterase